MNPRIYYALPSHQDECCVVAASPLVAYKDMRPHRLVIRSVKHLGELSWTVCNQYFPLYPDLRKYEFGSSYVFHGEESLSKAVKAFAAELGGIAHNIAGMFLADIHHLKETPDEGVAGP